MPWYSAAPPGVVDVGRGIYVAEDYSESTDAAFTGNHGMAGAWLIRIMD